MLEQTIKRFAGLLTKGDVLDLFKMLEKRYAAIARTCARIGIERKTFYNWENAKKINLETKEKVLRAALEDYPLDTLEFLAKKSKERCIEALSSAFVLLRRNMLEEQDPQKLRELAEMAKNILNEFSIPMTEFLEPEISALVETAVQKKELIEFPEIRTSYIEQFIGTLSGLTEPRDLSRFAEQRTDIYEEPKAIVSSVGSV